MERNNGIEDLEIDNDQEFEEALAFFKHYSVKICNTNCKVTIALYEAKLKILESALNSYCDDCLISIKPRATSKKPVKST